MDDLRGRRLAIHEAHTAPSCFARIVLRKHSPDPDRDLECVVRAPGDYQMDLRGLRDGSIDAASEEPKQRTMSVDGEHVPLDAVGRPR